jgi:hypothetical protein
VLAEPADKDKWYIPCVRTADRMRLRAAKKRDYAYFIRLQTLIELRDRAKKAAKYPADPAGALSASICDRGHNVL